MDYIESKMDFSPLFSNNSSFYIEKSKFLENIGDGVRTVEFITLKANKKLYFIEAKSTAPNPTNKDDFNDYCNKLLEKIQHSLDLFVSNEVNINKDKLHEFPDCFNANAFADYKLIFLLVIRKHKKEWLSDVLDGLHLKLIALRKIWKIEIVVWNGEKALEKGFIAEILEVTP